MNIVEAYVEEFGFFNVIFTCVDYDLLKEIIYNLALDFNAQFVDAYSIIRNIEDIDKERLNELTSGRNPIKFIICPVLPNKFTKIRSSYHINLSLNESLISTKKINKELVDMENNYKIDSIINKYINVSKYKDNIKKLEDDIFTVIIDRIKKKLDGGNYGTGKTTFTLYNDSESTYTYNDDNYMATGSGKSKTHKSKTRYNPGKALFSEKYMNNIITSSGDMAKIGYKAGTDKITHHGYHRFYPRFIEHLRSREKSGGRAMLEIGIQKSLSLSMWLNYFPYAYIYGIDIGVEDSGDRYTIFKADQSSNTMLQNIIDKKIKHEIFFIIDDGSHIPEHQISSFDLLFDKLLKPGGIYIIEDIETSYWTRGGLYDYDTRYGYKNSKSAIEIFKHLADDVNREFMTSPNQNKQTNLLKGLIGEATRSNISSITFGMNCVIITKMSEEEKHIYDDRKYRFARFL
jgi:hypothetical protein